MKNLRIRLEPDWTSEKVRREASTLLLDLKVAMWSVLKDQPETMRQISEVFFEERLANMRASGVETPIELAKYLAEMAANLTDAKVSISAMRKKLRSATMMYQGGNYCVTE